MEAPEKCANPDCKVDLTGKNVLVCNGTKVCGEQACCRWVFTHSTWAPKQLLDSMHAEG